MRELQAHAANDTLAYRMWLRAQPPCHYMAPDNWDMWKLYPAHMLRLDAVSQAERRLYSELGCVHLDMQAAYDNEPHRTVSPNTLEMSYTIDATHTVARLISDFVQDEETTLNEW